MANQRSELTRRAVLSYRRLKELTDWPDLMIKDYQGILQDFVFTADEIDEIESNAAPSLSSQVQFLQQQIDGLPEFTMDTEGFTMDETEFTMDKVIA